MNECSSNPCLNEGKCVDEINGFKCECLAGFRGRLCEEDINECLEQPCENGGECTDIVNDYVCRCPHGWFGKRCQTDIDECRHRPCQNGGECENEVSRFLCHCPPGYEGSTCEKEINECDANPCQHGGTCTDLLGSYKCYCPEGFRGMNCEENIDDCRINPCKNRGNCIDDVNSFKCICEPPYTGRICEIEMDPCASSPCANGAICSPYRNYKDFTCSCPIGFTGRYCDEDINECLTSSPCRNGASCRNTNGSYECLCKEGFEGRDCLVNTDDCAGSPCLNGGTCLDRTADYTCLCVPGFIGKNCQEDKNDCLLNPCQNGGKCTDYVNSITCTCPLGFSGTYCETNDEDCTPSSCMNGGQCQDGINNYTCHCPDGFKGSNCQSVINPCDSKPCKNAATCENVNGYARCHCTMGFTGSNCDQLVDWCSNNPCENGGQCMQYGANYRCSCPRGWTGKLCDVKMVSCEIAANFRGTSVSGLCENGGVCRNVGTSHTCDCKEGYWGSYCQHESNACSSNPCLNGATCNNMKSDFSCTCAPGYMGAQCELDINDCQPNHCKNGGVCNDLIDGFSCSCPPGTSGQLCEFNRNECYDGACHNGGVCKDKVGGFECDCKPGFTGARCEGDINECLSNPCFKYGTADCSQLINNYRCNCKPGWMGRHCESQQNFCANSPCMNGGTCTSTFYGHVCTCMQGYSGDNCELEGDSCQNDPCHNGGSCVPTVSGYRCECIAGTTGPNCDTDNRNECMYNRCQNGGQCIDRPGDYACRCLEYHRGKNCEIFDESSDGGVDITIDRILYGNDRNIDFQEDRRRCKQYDCKSKAGNKVCDEVCNTLACNFDDGDCNLGVNPWKHCNASSRGIACANLFNDGICNVECNTAACLFDGRDCETDSKVAKCRPEYDIYCTNNYRNGKCDEGCNTAECGWDGGDCDKPTKSKRPTDGSLFFVLNMALDKFHEQFKTLFERFLSLKLGTNLKVKHDENGHAMVYPFDPREIIADPSTTTFATSIDFMANDRESTIVVYMEVDNINCEEHCFNTSEEVANYIAAAYSEELRKDWGVMQIGETKTVSGDSTGPVGVIVGIITIALVLVCVGVLISNKTKKSKGITWFPDGFRAQAPAIRQGIRKSPDGQEMFGMPPSKHPSQFDIDRLDYLHDGWSDDDPNERPAKRNKRDNSVSGQTVMSDFDDADQRPWTAQHLSAADVKNPDILGALTPPQAEVSMNERMTNDVDVRGPCGLTPLMVASFRGGGLDTGDIMEEEDAETNVAIQDLIAQGANISTQMDKTGETPLHLAARYARADAAKKLLDAKADANAPDNTGRTPLHAAVAADAQGVFQILLRHRATNLDAKTCDGTTPLILAARLAIEGVVEELIQSDADINASDENGKSALHWAASVNNVDTVNTLLAHGANRDAQDHKDETPLFLSCREGSYQAAKALLDHCANRDITDHMDRLPRDVAQERLHHDIVRLLEEHIPPAPQPQISQPVLPLSSSDGHNQATPNKPKPKKRSKTIEGSPMDGGMLSPPSMGMHMNGLATLPKNRRPSVKRKKPEDMNGMMMSPDGDHTHFDNMFGHPMQQMQHRQEMMIMTQKQPPSYDDTMNGKMNPHHQSMATGLAHTNIQESQYFVHPRQQSIPASMTFTHLSPTHSQNLSPPHHSVMSPPQSVQSTHSLSPPGVSSSPQQMQHQSSSPIKSRGMMLPTSPTHLAAMRGATHLRHQAFDFPEAPVPAMNQMGGYYPYLPTPPQTGENGNFMTPSPESPSQWSSNSPQSHSDWSDGNIHSPPNYQQQQQQQQQYKPQDAVYI